MDRASAKRSTGSCPLGHSHEKNLVRRARSPGVLSTQCLTNRANRQNRKPPKRERVIGQTHHTQRSDPASTCASSSERNVSGTLVKTTTTRFSLAAGSVASTDWRISRYSITPSSGFALSSRSTALNGSRTSSPLSRIRTHTRISHSKLIKSR